MASNYNDDEPVTVESEARASIDLRSGKIALRIFNKADAPLEKTDYRLVVELMGSDTGDQRYGVDIVAVLDVSGSMQEKSLKKVKTSMKFLVEKLSPIDRLSIVTFSSDADRLCPLTGMHKNGQAKVEDLINNLRADGQTNITRGLQEALRVLAQRRQRNGRTSAIMLISDGELSLSCDHPSTVDVSGVPVFTFGLGKDHDIQVLQDIASRSDNGTYSIADNVEGSDSSSLTIAISSCLAGLLSVVVQDLKLTVTQLGSDIQDVRAGNYEQTRDNESVTISFGNIYNREKRKTALFLSLPAVEERTAIDILKVTLSYRPSGGRTLLIKHSPITVALARTSSPVTVDPVELVNEIARGDTAAGMQTARKQADANDFEGAKKTLDNAEKSLDHLNREADELIKALKYEVQEFLRLLKDPETYLREGHAFALSSELSHNRQRFAARADATQLLALAIPLVVLFANQAIEFEKNIEVRQCSNTILTPKECSNKIKISNKRTKSMNYNDDEPIPVPSAAPTSDGQGLGKIVQNIFSKADAPLEKTDYRLVVELMGLDTGDQRCGVDIVAVLDVSGSMNGKKLEKLKTAMKFLVKKLSPIDRLSIVTFSWDARRLCPLTGMHKDGQANIEMLINKLRASGGTNITPGLQIALSMLAQRRQQEGRTSAIMLMCDGALSSRCVHPSKIDVSGVHVYTFGLGWDHDSQLLQEIASRSDKGTYSIADVEGSDSASLNIAFSSCLAGLLSVVVQDLELTITQMESEIQELRAGNYDQTRVNESVVISFGNLYNHEKRNTTVFLSLPAVQDRTTIDIVQVTFSYRPSGGGALIKSASITATVSRTSSPVTVDDPVEVGNEVARGDIVAAMQTARKQADAKDFDEAMKTLDNAGKSIDNLNRDADELIKALNHEVQEFLRLLKNPRTYREGCAFALSSELSHNLQRFAVRGDATQLLTFAIPLAVLFANQAIEFEKNIDIEVSQYSNNIVTPKKCSNNIEISNKMGRMSTNYDDDEPIPVPSAVPTLSDGLGPAKIVQNIFSKADSPLEKNDYSLVVELMGLDTGEQRYGVDLIAVLDMSGSMRGKKLEKLKTAMKFLVKKLSPIDRLSIVTFSMDARRLCPLTGMHKDGQAYIEMLINNLDANGGTNITPGLQTALTMLAQRRQHEGRTSAIMLMSDGEISSRCDHPSTVDVSGVPVYTFGLGRDHDSQLLQEIASRSDKGTYSIADVEGSNSASLNIAFSSCLAGLLSVVVQDLELTITKKESELHEVCAGSYDQTRVNESVTISFGNLYHREKLNTTVFLSLPAIQDGTDSDILEVTYSYRPSGGGALIKSAPITATVTRTTSPVTVDDPVEVGNEIARGDTAAAMQSARKQADANDFDGAMKTLEYAGKLLDNLNGEVDELVKALKYELQEFLRLLKDPQTYLREGRAFALSSELSHNLQRFAARGDTPQLLPLAIPLVVLFANQALEFEKNNNIEVCQFSNDILTPKKCSNNIKISNKMERNSTNYNDDEPTPVPSVAPTSDGHGLGKIVQNIFSKADAPSGKTDYRLVVELMGLDTGDRRCGVDIVAVLDVSGSMGGKKLEKLKTSMKFLVKKLSEIDCLSIVTFSTDGQRLCPLTGMHKDGQAKIENLINKLRAGGYTNITPGLQIAVSMLAERKKQEGRTSAIMLMSDGELSDGCDHPSTVDVSGVPVYTFGLGKDHDCQLLQEIASRSDKGTYSIADVEGSNSASLNIAFSLCLAGLLSVVVQDLELTITQKESELHEVCAGSYDQTRVNESVTISFGNLYNCEKLNTTVFLSLPAIQDGMTSDILKVTYSYRPSGGGALTKSTPITATVTRTSSLVTVYDPVEVGNEIARGDTAAAMQSARKQADAKDLDGAMKTLEYAGKLLGNLNREEDELVKALKYEVQEFSRLLNDPWTYLKEGRAFALSSELSHNLQRFAARGDATQLLALAIPLVVPFTNQAIEFNQNLNIEVPSADEDMKKAAEQTAKLDKAAGEEKKELDEQD